MTKNITSIQFLTGFQVIITEENQKINNPHVSSANAGTDTEDNVFLLSIKEVEKYFKSDSDMYADNTTYATYQGASYLGDSRWMTRSPSFSSNAPAYVLSNKGINNVVIVTVPTGVRPAIWLDFSSEYFMDSDVTETSPGSVEERPAGYDGL